MIRTSMACRTCHRGWWGSPSDICDRCKKPAVVTGEVLVIDLNAS